MIDTLAELEAHLPGGVPTIWRVAIEKGYGAALGALNEKVYFNKNSSLSPLITEALQCACLSNCDNVYCAVMHARGMVTLGMTFEEVRHFAVSQELPARVEDSGRWSAVMRRVHNLFRSPGVTSKLYSSLRGLLTPAELVDVEAIIAFSLLHKFFLEAFQTDIDVSSEHILFETVQCGPELIEVFSSRAPETPIMTICCMCKDVKSTEGWIPVERMVAKISDSHALSHGLCPKCTDAMEREMTAYLQKNTPSPEA